MQTTLTETSPYYSPDFPFLSACLAICCAPLEERQLFWPKSVQNPDGDPERFCRVRFRLSGAQTDILLSPKLKPGRPYCYPNNDQIDEVIAEIDGEIQGRKPVQGSAPPPLDPDLAAEYETLVALHTAYCLGQGTSPPNWRRHFKNEAVSWPVRW